jgi:hypothetical protein
MAINETELAAAQAHLLEKRRELGIPEHGPPKQGQSPSAGNIGDASPGPLGDDLAQTVEQAKRAQARAQGRASKPAAAAAKVRVKNLPWIPLDVARYARPEYINAHPVAKCLAEAFMVAYWRNECRGLPTSWTLLAPILNGSWRSIKTHLDAIVSIQELQIDNNNGHPLFRCKWLDDAWTHAEDVSEKRRKAANERHANA